MPPKKHDVTEKCPQCNGDGTVPGRYTDANPVVCPTCGGDGNVAKDPEPVEADAASE